MGNTLSPIIADIYMDFYLQKHLNEVNLTNKIWRYVDDILIVTKKSEDELKDYVERLNTISGTIRFTFEYEVKNKINFLDTTVARRDIDNQIRTKVRWFRKDTATDRLLNYDSCHSKAIKNNIVKNMTTRILQTSKETEEQKEDLSTLKLMLLNSNYPSQVIERLMKQACQTVTSTTQDPQRESKPETKFSFSLPYVPGIEVLKRRLEQLKIKLYFSYPNRLQSGLNQSMKSRSKSVIYQVSCDCIPRRSTTEKQRWDCNNE